MRVFLDFEASSLAKRSYPIEVAWVFEDGVSESYLIRPAPEWTEWSAEAEAIHHLSREQIERDGMPHRHVAERMLAALTGHSLHASAPSWDGKWLSALLRATDIPRHSLRLRDSDEACFETGRQILGDLLPALERDAALADLLAFVRSRTEAQPVAHRALADAEAERAVWLAMREEATGLADRLRTARP